MTYHAPTETNPPFTTPPTWPFPTSSADWEPDYRLRLLETALVYMWTNGSGPGPPGPVGPQGPAGPAGPATAGLYAAVGTATPPTNGSTIVPPEGFFWVDTSTSQVNPLPPPLTSGQPFTTYTDPYGKIWIAQGGVNGGAWKDPKDVLHAQYYRNAAYTFAAASQLLTMDTVVTDPYSLYNVGTSLFTIPITGLWRIAANLTALPTAAGQSIQVTVGTGGGTGMSTFLSHSGVAYYVTGLSIYTASLTAGSTWGIYRASNTTLNGTTGQANSFMTIDYLGTG